MPYLYSSPYSNMPKTDKRPSAASTRRAQPYTLPSARSSMPSASGNMGHRHTESNASDRHSAIPWTPHNDDQLMRARQQGMNWQPIADKYFPDKTANACRKRHERLMEKRNANGAWNGLKFEEVAKAYVDVREEMWKMVAERVGERSWQLIESKVCCLPSAPRDWPHERLTKGAVHGERRQKPFEHGPSRFPQGKNGVQRPTRPRYQPR